MIALGARRLMNAFEGELHEPAPGH
jgi:hypothetical protein